MTLGLDPISEGVVSRNDTKRRPAGRIIGPEDAARVLENSEDYRVLRRMKVPPLPALDLISGAKVGIFVDCETEGLDAEDKIIEIAMVRFQYDPAARRLISLLDPPDGYSALEDPGRPLSEDIKRLTGLRDEDLSSKRFSEDEVRAFMSDADIVIAHNASFDRPRFEKRFPEFKSKPWACTVRDVDWSSEGVGGTKLDYLAFRFGFFFDGHRATHDCYAGLEILSRSLPETRRPVLEALLENASQSKWRLFVKPNFGENEKFRALGYRWCGKERSSNWYMDFPTEKQALEAKSSILSMKVGSGIQVDSIEATDRYTKREFLRPGKSS